MNTVPTDNKTPKGRIKRDWHHETLYWHFCGQGVGHTSNLNWSVDSWEKSMRSIGYVCGQEVVVSRKEKRAVFRAGSPQNKYLTYEFFMQVQLPDPRMGKEHVTWCALVLVEVDTELRSRSEAYLLTHLLLTSLVPMAWMQAWVSQPKHAQLFQVVLMIKNKWGLLLPSPSGHHTSSCRHATVVFSWWLHASI